MASIAKLYNNLPSLEEANKQFVNRLELFSKLGPLLASHGQQFGVCLIHRHCTLEEGEKMVATGNISQPETDDGECYPERWLVTGEPYEFTRDPTMEPPAELFQKFQEIVHNVDVLGLYYVGGEEQKPGFMKVERTEGRKNIVEVVYTASTQCDSVKSYESSTFEGGGIIGGTIGTGWVPGADDKFTMQDECVCQSSSHSPCPGRVTMKSNLN